jgi:uncharacterized protein (DUF2147 family)
MSIRAAAIVLAMLGLTAPVLADPIGTWLTENGRSRIRIENCGGALCGNLVWLKEPNDPETGKPKLDKNNSEAGKRTRPLIGVPIVLNMQAAGSNKWSGQVYNAEDGKTYSGSITQLGPSAIRLEGCALGGLVCKAQTWNRTQ